MPFTADTSTSAVATDAELAGAASQAGFPREEFPVAVAVALAESSGNRNAQHVNANGTVDKGAWQINSVHTAIINSGDPFNLHDNAKMAFTVWQQAGGKWTPWSTFTSGKYRLYLPRGEAATKVQANSPTDTRIDIPGVTPAVQGVEALATFLTKVTNPKTWVSIALITLGAVLLMIVAVKLVMTSSPVKKIVNTAADVVPGGSIAKKAINKGAKGVAKDALKKGIKNARKTAPIKPPEVPA